MSTLARNGAAHAPANSAPDHSVSFHGSRGKNVSSLSGAWHRRRRSVREIVDQIQTKISSPGEIAEDVQVPIFGTSLAVNPSTGQGPQKQAKPQVATNPKSPKSPNFPIGPPILEIQLVYLGWLGGKWTVTLRVSSVDHNSLFQAREQLLAPRIGQ